MKKIFVSVFIIAVVLGVMGAGVLAQWTGTATISSNRIMAGSVEIELTNEAKTSPPVAMDLEGMCPCDWEWYTFQIHNLDCDGTIWLHFHDITSGTCHLENYIDVDIKIDGNIVLPQSAHVKLGDLECHCIELGDLDSGEWMKVELSFHLQCDTPDECQCEEMYFDITSILTPDKCPPPECATCIWLENKGLVTGWESDDIWGFACYDVGSLNVKLWGFGLDANTDYQVSINSPEVAAWYPISGGEEQRKKMANALATGTYDSSLGTAPPLGYNLFERGYYDLSFGGNDLYADPPDGGWQDDTIATFTTSKSGDTARTHTSDNMGVLYADVSFDLPPGKYEYIKLVVKEDTSPWSPVLMEETTPLFFTIPEP